MLVEQRKKAGLRQVDLAKKMGVYQSWVTHMESGQRRIDVIALMELGKAIGFDAADMVRSCRSADCAAFPPLRGSARPTLAPCPLFDLDTVQIPAARSKL
jgi:transcriptional regulator with XRE-family HTH domain